MKTIGKPRKKKDGSYELPINCTVCGANRTGTVEVNSRTGKWNCFRCNSGGSLTQEQLSSLSSFSTLILPENPKGSEGVLVQEELTDKFPEYVLQEIKRRKQEVAWVVHRYNALWNGSRLVFPAGEGSSKRACLPWESPKTLSSSPRGLLGQHLLLTLGLRLVLTEGDWKTLSIPLPWVGLGSLGKSLSDSQAWTIRCSNPKEVLVCYDGGCERQSDEAVKKLAPLPARTVYGLPYGKGPDDIPKKDLISLLMRFTS